LRGNELGEWHAGGWLEIVQYRVAGAAIRED
jgi:hypothetical protein